MIEKITIQKLGTGNWCAHILKSKKVLVLEQTQQQVINTLNNIYKLGALPLLIQMVKNRW